MNAWERLFYAIAIFMMVTSLGWFANGLDMIHLPCVEEHSR